MTFAHLLAQATALLVGMSLLTVLTLITYKSIQDDYQKRNRRP